MSGKMEKRKWYIHLACAKGNQRYDWSGGVPLRIERVSQKFGNQMYLIRDAADELGAYLEAKKWLMQEGYWSDE